MMAVHIKVNEQDLKAATIRERESAGSGCAGRALAQAAQKMWLHETLANALSASSSDAGVDMVESSCAG